MVYQMRDLNPVWRKVAKSLNDDAPAFAWTGSERGGKVTVYLTNGYSVVVSWVHVREYCNQYGINYPTL